jgi:3,4-dihydroxy 2-butanone 4-phosphate synthase / GTP cyclohydrolase II
MSRADLLAEAAADLEAGGPVVVIDETALDGAGRGFFLHAAALATEAVVNTAIVHGRGLTCFSVTPEQAMRLGLMLGGEYRQDHPGPVFLRSVESATCDGTGISAADRALTLRAAGAPDAGIFNLKSPGHVMPAMAGAERGRRRAVADLALDVLRGLTTHEVAAWTDILDDDGEVADAAWCQGVAYRLGLPCVNVSVFEKSRPAAVG